MYIATACSFTAWTYERKGKKRAIKEVGDLRRKVEESDAYSGRSGLTDVGDTPKR